MSSSALCKYRGMLVVAEVVKAADGIGGCWDCGSSRFRRHAGWVECCDCSFAIEEKAYDRIVTQKESNNER